MVRQVDCLIVGGGPAGLTAATYLGRFRRETLLVDRGESRASWIPLTRNVLGFPEGVNGVDLLNSLRDQSNRYGARITAGFVQTIEKRLDGTFAADLGSEQILASKVLLATGGLDIEPQMDDARAAVDAGLIRHCPICDAFEATGKRIGLVAYGKCRIKEALLLRGYTSDLTVLTLGRAAEISFDDREILARAGVRIVYQPVERLSREGDKIAAWIAGTSAPLFFDTIYSALGMQIRSELAVSLGAEVDDDGALTVDRHQQTTVAGLYAAGDVVHGLSQVSVAAGQAAIASTAINAALPMLQF